MTPIGAPDSKERNRADRILEYVLEPALTGYEIVRADKIDNPGSINIDIIQRLHQATLVVADLTSFNPNVMYEVGVRHSFNKPIIQIAQAGEKLPFDLATERTIFFDLTDVASVEDGKKRIAAAIQSLDNGPKYSGPVERALNMAAVFSGGSDVAKAIESLSDQVEALGESMWLSARDPWSDDIGWRVKGLHSLFSGLTTYDAEKIIRYIKKVVKEAET